MKVTVLSHQCQVFNVTYYEYDHALMVDVLGGTGEPRSIWFEATTYTVAETHRWLHEAIDMDLLAAVDEQGEATGQLFLRPAAVEPNRPLTDTPASRYFDGKKQGQFDQLRLLIRNALTPPLPQRKKDV